MWRWNQVENKIFEKTLKERKKVNKFKLLESVNKKKSENLSFNLISPSFTVFFFL